MDHETFGDIRMNGDDLKKEFVELRSLHMACREDTTRFTERTKTLQEAQDAFNKEMKVELHCLRDAVEKINGKLLWAAGVAAGGGGLVATIGKLIVEKL